MIEATEKELNIIRNILSKYVPNSQIRVFGSRINGKAKKFSDIDLAIFSDKKLDMLTLSLIENDFEDCDLPYRVEILDWNSISPEFKRVIEDRYELLNLG